MVMERDPGRRGRRGGVGPIVDAPRVVEEREQLGDGNGLVRAPVVRRSIPGQAVCSGRERTNDQEEELAANPLAKRASA
jgi:hypothetical protein